ncbi:MAG TPA: hypothetical protein VK628_06420 [Flavitalea sp.]|nr:hypothetical protein [Flavitalea sp.]
MTGCPLNFASIVSGTVHIEVSLVTPLFHFANVGNIETIRGGCGHIYLQQQILCFILREDLPILFNFNLRPGSFTWRQLKKAVLTKTFEAMMLIAILVPALSFLLRGKILASILCFLLQVTLIGWLPAAFWAVMSLNNERADRRTDRLIRAIAKNKA